METVPTSNLGRSPSDASSSTIQQSYQADSDLDADPNPDWQSRIDSEVLATLTDREKKRQDVLNGKLIRPLYVIFSNSCLKNLFNL
jgi:hypothetical protein